MSNKITSAIAPGTVLHGEAYDYKIIKTLGQGSFGITYQAKVQMKGALGTLDSNMYVAVKEFFMKEVNGRSGDTVTSGSTSKGGLFSYYREKFEREARNLGTLKHPNIVRVLEMFIANGTAYYAMEFINGMSLDDTIAKSPQGRLSTEQAIRLTKQIGAAVSFMHSRKMLHLDVKPANVMVRADGKAVLIDFGLSKQYDESGQPESSTTVGGGTPGYAPLEQASYRDGHGFPVVMDVYALGATMFKMLSGQRPPEASEILNEGFPESCLLAANTPRHIIRCIEKAMAPLKKDRYQSVDQFVTDLCGKAEGTDQAGYYTGYVKDGMRQGEGTIMFDNGTVAVGNWEHDRMNGKGTATASNGRKYEGEIKDNKFDGFGTLTYEKGGKYIGTWKDDKKDGYGIEVLPDESELRSTFKDGQPDGFYMYVQKGGEYRIGKFEGGKLEGHSFYFGDDGKPMYALFKDDKCVETTDLTATSRPGTYSYKHTYDNGTYVEGNITNGKGLCKYPNGAVYEGEWKDSDRHGFGICKYHNGDVYEGEWKDSNPHGFGIYRFKNGDIYIGQWNEGKHDGTGIYFYKSSNDAYAGEWRDGKRCYNGTYLWYESGNAYVGQWSDNKMSGFGTMYYRNSKCSRGRWANDKLVEKL